MTALGYLGWGLLGLLVAVGLLLCLPVRLRVRYHTGEPPEAELRWLLLRFDLLEAKEQPEKPPAEKPKKKRKTPAKPVADEPMTFLEKMQMILDLIGSLKGAAGMLVRNFRLSDIRLKLVVVGEDAAETAITYGRANALVYSCYALARCYLRMQEPKIDIRPDFVGEDGRVEFSAEGRLTPLVAVGAGIRAGCAFLRRILRRKRQAQPTEQEHSNRPPAREVQGTSDRGGKEE